MSSPVSQDLELLLVVDRHAEHPSGLGELGLQVAGVAEAERALRVDAVLGLAQRGAERVIRTTALSGSDPPTAAGLAPQTGVVLITTGVSPEHSRWQAAELDRSDRRRT